MCNQNLPRCPWALHSLLETSYHDTQWCVETHNDLFMFEMLVLETMQAGLSWSLILEKQESMRRAFDGFNPEIIATYSDNYLRTLLENPRIVRNRLKIKSLVTNAQAFLRLQKEAGAFDTWIWSYAPTGQIVNEWETADQVPSCTDLSVRLSRDLKSKGFSFVGPVITYSFMQAIGLVNDHVLTCFKNPQNTKRSCD